MWLLDTELLQKLDKILWIIIINKAACKPAQLPFMAFLLHLHQYSDFMEINFQSSEKESEANCCRKDVFFFSKTLHIYITCMTISQFIGNYRNYSQQLLDFEAIIIKVCIFYSKYTILMIWIQTFFHLWRFTF